VFSIKTTEVLRRNDKLFKLVTGEWKKR
jgi:hypothetical protein